jgi:hypothetical protein
MAGVREIQHGLAFGRERIVTGRIRVLVTVLDTPFHNPIVFAARKTFFETLEKSTSLIVQASFTDNTDRSD